MKGYELEAAMKKLEAGYILMDPMDIHLSRSETHAKTINSLVLSLKVMDKRIVMLEKKIKAHDKALQRARNLIKSLQG